VAGEGQDLALDATAQAPARDTVATVPPIALDPTLANGSAVVSEKPALPVTRTPLLRYLFVASATLGAANILYFVARFIVTAHPPALTPIFQSGGDGGDVGFLGGPMVVLTTTALVAIVFLSISTWVAHHHRRDPMMQLMCALAILGGQISISVTLLTSADTFVPARAVAAAVYVLVPAAGFITLAIYPSGRPVPRLAPYLVPFAIIPFLLQARLMLFERG
jgi:hypothetical protein